jgi:curli production assembly/transport component CsgE
MRRYYLIILLLVTTYTSNSRANEEVEIGGLLLNNTISNSGYQFYYHLNQYWLDIPNTQGINVRISEQIIPKAGTRVSMHLNHKVIYTTYMGRRKSPVKHKVKTAIYKLIDEIAKLEQQQYGSIDLAESGW